MKLCYFYFKNNLYVPYKRDSLAVIMYAKSEITFDYSINKRELRTNRIFFYITLCELSYKLTLQSILFYCKQTM